MYTLPYKEFKKVVEVLPELNNFLPKNNEVVLEDASTTTYENLKQLIAKQGIVIPVCLVQFETKYYLIDGFTRFKIIDEDLKVEPDYPVPYTLIELEGLTKDNLIPSIKAWMWELNQSIRGHLASPKLNTVMMGLKYNLNKNSRGGDRKSNPQFDGLKNTAQDIAVEFSVGKATVERAGTLVTNLHALAELYSKPDNTFYYLYEKGVSQNKLAKLSQIQKGSKDYKKLEKLLEDKDAPAVSIFVTEKELEEARLKQEKKAKASRLISASASGHPQNIAQLYADKGLTQSNLEQLKKLERRLKTSVDKEWFSSGVRSITGHSNYLKFVVEVNSKFPDNNKLGEQRKLVTSNPPITKVEKDAWDFSDVDLENTISTTKEEIPDQSEEDITQDVLLELDLAIRKMAFRSSLSKYAEKFNELYSEMMEKL